MQAQLKRILEAAQAPNVTFQMIPYDKGAHPGMADSFVQMGFDDPVDPELIYWTALLAACSWRPTLTSRATS